MKNLLKHITLAVALIGSLALADVASAQSMQGRGRPSSSQQSQPRGNSGGQHNNGGQRGNSGQSSRGSGGQVSRGNGGNESRRGGQVQREHQRNDHSAPAAQHDRRNDNRGGQGVQPGGNNRHGGSGDNNRGGRGNGGRNHGDNGGQSTQPGGNNHNPGGHGTQPGDNNRPDRNGGGNNRGGSGRNHGGGGVDRNHGDNNHGGNNHGHGGVDRNRGGNNHGHGGVDRNRGGNNHGGKPGGRPHDYRHHPNRNHYDWNYRHHDWSRPAPPPHRAYRPAPWRYYRPHYPPHYRPYYGAPIIDRILGITFGTLFDITLDYLYGNGYYIDGYADNIIYLRDVSMLNLMWPDVMLCYDGGRLANAQFVYSTGYSDRARYNRLYHDLSAVYGPPIDLEGGMVTWFGGNETGYVTLQMTTGGGRYYTTLSVGY